MGKAKKKKRVARVDALAATGPVSGGSGEAGVQDGAAERKKRTPPLARRASSGRGRRRRRFRTGCEGRAA